MRGRFTTRADGNLSYRVGGGDPRAARAALAAGLGVPGVAWGEQVHGAAVAYVGLADAVRGHADQAEAFAGVDALVTDVPGTALGVLVADCLPVLIADADRRLAGVAHAGRRGLAAGVVEATVAALRALGATRLTALVGPGIGPCCYEVGDDVAAEVAGRVPTATTRSGRTSLDLPAAALRVLADLGVEARWDGRCTYDDGALFSHRRAPGEGRGAGVVVA